jgi:hypothetical protein
MDEADNGIGHALTAGGSTVADVIFAPVLQETQTTAFGLGKGAPVIAAGPGAKDDIWALAQV